MTDKITCPVCGGDMNDAYTDDGDYGRVCLNDGCPLDCCIFTMEEISKPRPLETALRSEIAALKARCTWKRALDVTPPLEKNVIVQCYFQGIIRARFEFIEGKLYYHKPHDNYYSPVTNETYWIDMPDMPEEK